MARKRPKFEVASLEIVGAVKSGLSLVDASRQTGVSKRTVDNWLTRGRHEPDSKYAPFAAAVDGAKDEPGGSDGRMSLEELHVVVARTARKGSTPAQKLMWEMLLHDDRGDEEGVETDPLAGVDEVAARRQQRSAA